MSSSSCAHVCAFLKCVLPSCRSVRVLMSLFFHVFFMRSFVWCHACSCAHMLMSCRFCARYSAFSFVCFAFGAFIRVSLHACFVLSNAICIQVILMVLEFLLVLTHSDFRGWVCHGIVFCCSWCNFSRRSAAPPLLGCLRLLNLCMEEFSQVHFFFGIGSVEASDVHVLLSRVVCRVQWETFG